MLAYFFSTSFIGIPCFMALNCVQRLRPVLRNSLTRISIVRIDLFTPPGGLCEKTKSVGDVWCSQLHDKLYVCLLINKRNWCKCLLIYFRVSLCKLIQDSLGFWISRCGFRIAGTGFHIFCHWNLDSEFQSLVRLGFLELNYRFKTPGFWIRQ